MLLILLLSHHPPFYRQDKCLIIPNLLLNLCKKGRREIEEDWGRGKCCLTTILEILICDDDDVHTLSLIYFLREKCNLIPKMMAEKERENCYTLLYTSWCCIHNLREIYSRGGGRKEEEEDTQPKVSTTQPKVSLCTPNEIGIRHTMIMIITRVNRSRKPRVQKKEPHVRLINCIRVPWVNYTRNKEKEQDRQGESKRDVVAKSRDRMERRRKVSWGKDVLLFFCRCFAYWPE